MLAILASVCWFQPRSHKTQLLDSSQALCFLQTETAESFAHMLNYVCQELHRQDVAAIQQAAQQAPAQQGLQQLQFSPQKPLVVTSTSVPTSPQFHVPRNGYNSMPNTPKVNVRRADAPPIKMGW